MSSQKTSSDPFGLHGRKVDDGSRGGGGNLDQFEPGNKGVFPDEFRIQRQSWTLPQCVAEGFKRSAGPSHTAEVT